MEEEEECGNTKRPRLCTSLLRDELKKQDVIKNLQSSWVEGNNFESSLKSYNIHIIHEPFKVCIISDIVDDISVLKSACSKIENLALSEKSNDLYQFMQSDDLRNLNDSEIKTLYNFLSDEVRCWLCDIFGIEFDKNKVASTFSCYSFSDRLLCHDDKCEDRHIAFVLYLTETWETDFGGALQLFNTDSNGDPKDIVYSIYPKFNTMVMFEVTDTSFHQVAEVIKQGKRRLSLNGWFHSSAKKLDKDVSSCCHKLPVTLSNKTEFVLDEYVNPSYCDSSYQIELKIDMTDTSEMQLLKFLLPNIYSDIRVALRNDDLTWTYIGPANIRKYEVAEVSSLPSTLATFKNLLESELWFKYLHNITGLDFVPSKISDMDAWNKGEQPYCNVEFQRWTPGCYTLIHDNDPEFHSVALDVFLRFQWGDDVDDDDNNDDESQSCDGEGTSPEPGSIIFLDKISSDNEYLLEYGNKYNGLGLVFRDTKTVRFTKYLDVTSTSFYQISCTYRPWKPPADEPYLHHKPDGDSDSSDSISSDDN